MLKNVYQYFNAAHFSAEKYKRLLADIHAAAGDTCLRMCETPVFVSRAFAERIVRAAEDIIAESMALKGKLDGAVPPHFKVAGAPDRPAFFIIDFAVTKDGPKLIEMQGFASNLAFIPAVAEIYKNVYGLGEGYTHVLSAGAMDAVRKTILNGHAPENVILMEVNPWEQDSRRDFVVTQKWLGIPVIDVRDVIKKGNHLFYRDKAGKEVRVRRIYSRLVADDFVKYDLFSKMQFSLADPMEVEWAGDVSWFLRISKYTMPFLRHPAVPETRFLDEVASYPDDLENYVLKPVFSNAGGGIKLNITRQDLDAVPVAERHNYVLMKKVAFMPFIPDPEGHMLNAELRVMLVWPDKLVPVAMSARVMRGNDTNAGVWGDNRWCGLTPVLIAERGE